MKIMIIQPWIRQGGAELISVYLAYELENQGHEASIVCLYVDNEGMPHVADRVRYIVPSPWISQWLSSSRIAFLLLGPWILLKLVRDNASKFDVLNPHNFPSMWVAILVSMVKKVPVIWTCNEPPTRIALQDIVQIGLGDFIGWLLACSPIDRWFARKVEIIHVLSHRAKSQVQERYGRNSCVVRSGVDCELFAHTPDHQIVQEHNLENKFVLLTVGKLHPQKNHVMLIDALYNIRPRIPNAVVLIVSTDHAAFGSL